MTSRDWVRVFAFGVGALVVLAALYLVAVGLGFFTQAADVTSNEFGPAAALAKYEWFVDQANYIKNADANVTIFQQKLADVDTTFNQTYGADRTKWMPSTQALYVQAKDTAKSDLAGVIGIRNALVRDYNAQSEKFNWALFDSKPEKLSRSYTIMPGE